MREKKLKSDSYVAVVHLISVFVIGWVIGIVLVPVAAALSLMKAGAVLTIITFILNAATLWLAIWLSARYFVTPYYILTNAPKIVQRFFIYILILTAIGYVGGIAATLSGQKPITDFLSVQNILGTIISLAIYYYASMMYIKATPETEKPSVTPPPAVTPPNNTPTV